MLNHSGGEFSPHIRTIFDCTVLPSVSPSFGVTSAYQNSPHSVSEESTNVESVYSVCSNGSGAPSVNLNQEIDVPDSMGCSTSKYS